MSWGTNSFGIASWGTAPSGEQFLWPDSQVAISNVEGEDATTTNLHEHINNDAPWGESVSYIRNPDRFDGYLHVGFENTPADFGSMTTLAADADVLADNVIDDTYIVSVQIVNASAVALTNAVTVATEADTTRVQRRVAWTLTPQGEAAGKLEWDAAHIEIVFDNTVSSPPDTILMRMIGHRIVYTYSTTSGITKTVNDAAVGSDQLSGPVVSVGVTDIGVGVDSQPLSAAVSLVDIASGIDAISGLTATVVVSDPATGADITSVITSILKQVQEIGSGVDGVTQIAELLAADAGIAVDLPQLSVTIQVLDIGAGVDALTKFEQLLKTVADAASGVDALLLTVNLPVADAGSGIDSTSISAVLSVLESAGATDIAVRYASGIQKIASISFTLKGRSINFTLH